jgi:heptosyltransferase-2
MALPVVHGKFGFSIRYRLGRSLKARNYSHAIILPRSWKSALLPYFAAVPVRTGYKGEMRYGLVNDIRLLDKSVLTQTVQRYVAHAYDSNPANRPETPFPSLSVDKANTEHLLNELGLNLSRPVIGIMPGAEYGPAKQWPAEYYADLTSMLVESGNQVWVFGSGKEAALAETIVSNVPENAYNLCGRTELADVVDLVACTEQVVTNDSGLMHVAAAVGVRVNVIYGSSTPIYTPPLTNNADVFYKGLSCSPCFDRHCRFKHYKCLTDIQPREVMQKIIKQ